MNKTNASIGKRATRIAMVVLLCAVGSHAMAQASTAARRPEPDRLRDKTAINVPCCLCADGKSGTVDLSTGVAPWTSPDGPVSTILVTPGWKTPTPPASWVYTGSNNPGTYTYNLKINVPTNCLLTPKVTYDGQAFGDNHITVTLDDKTLGTTAVSSSGQANYGFRDPYGVNVSGGLGPGSHTLSVKVRNDESVTGFLMSGKLRIQCPNNRYTSGNAAAY